MHSEESNVRSLLPVFAEQSADLLEDLRIELRRGRESVGTRQRSEVFVAQLELNGAGVEVGLAQAASNHLGQAHERGFDLRGVRCVVVIGVLVADGFRLGVGANFVVEPSTSIFATRLAGERESPLPEASFEFAFFQPSEITNLLDSERV